MHFSLLHQNRLERFTFISEVLLPSVGVSRRPVGEGTDGLDEHSRGGPLLLQNLMGPAQIALQQFLCLLEISVSLTSGVVLLIETKIFLPQLRELYSDVHFRIVTVLYLSQLLWRVVDFARARSFLGGRVRALGTRGRKSSQRLNLFPSGPNIAASFVLTLGL